VFSSDLPHNPWIIHLPSLFKHNLNQFTFQAKELLHIFTL
jgi:hypothetical protein